MSDDSGTRGSDRMPERYRTTVRIHDVFGDAEFSNRMNGDGRESLVDFDSDKIVYRER